MEDNDKEGDRKEGDRIKKIKNKPRGKIKNMIITRNGGTRRG